MTVLGEGGPVPPKRAAESEWGGVCSGYGMDAIRQRT